MPDPGPAQQGTKKRSQVIVALPAYNEESNIGNLIDRIEQAMIDANLPWRLVVVDDGSRDRTYSILQDYQKRVPLTIGKHEVNQGLGPTIRDALEMAANMAADNDVIVTMDADESHPPGLIPRVAARVHEGHDVVIASRYQPGARVCGLSAFRTWMSNGASWLFRLALPIPGVKDYTCGFRGYSGRALKQVQKHYGPKLVEMAGFHCMADILIKCGKLGLICGEVPFILRYDLKQSQSKMKVWKTVGQTLMLLLRRRFQS